MHLEILVEEPSAQSALELLIPKIVGSKITFTIHSHQGKQDLLKKLPGKLKGYSKWINEEIRIVVLLDLDREDCMKLKDKLNQISENAGLTSKNSGDKYQIINRIVIQELESWFFGDINAIVRTYSKVKIRTLQNSKYSNPDLIPNTCEELEAVLKLYNYYENGLEKVKNARMIAGNMEVNSNTSLSFKVFCDGIREISGN